MPVNRKYPLEELLVTTHGHQVGSSGEQFDHIGREHPTQRALAVAQSTPLHPGEGRGRHRPTEEADAQHQATARQDHSDGGHGDDGGDQCGDERTDTS